MCTLSTIVGMESTLQKIQTINTTEEMVGVFRKLLKLVFRFSVRCLQKNIIPCLLYHLR